MSISPSAEQVKAVLESRFEESTIDVGVLEDEASDGGDYFLGVGSDTVQEDDIQEALRRIAGWKLSDSVVLRGELASKYQHIIRQKTQ